jgi:hypothetical protein
MVQLSGDPAPAFCQDLQVLPSLLDQALQPGYFLLVVPLFRIELPNLRLGGADERLRLIEIEQNKLMMMVLVFL